MADIADVDESLIDVPREADLLNFGQMFVFDKQSTRVDHFLDVTNAELQSYGLSEPAIRRFRDALNRKRKKRAKLFGGAKRPKRTIQLRREAESTKAENIFELSTKPHLIAKNEVKLMETLGEENFSVVKRALWTRPNGTKTDCAVKISHEMSEAVRQDLASEISTMQHLRHQNLVQLFGVVFADRIL